MSISKAEKNLNNYAPLFLQPVFARTLFTVMTFGTNLKIDQFSILGSLLFLIPAKKLQGKVISICRR